MTETHTNWKEVVVRKRATREALLPKKWLVPDSNLPSEDVFDVTALCAQKGWLSDLELEITSKTVTELSEEIKTGRLTSVQVISAFAHRATIAHQLTNCLTEINFGEALMEAERLDAHLESTGQTVGPLHGVPISFKDQFPVKGLDTTMGYCSWAGRIAEQDCNLVDTLRKAGAIIFTKTNNALTLMIEETINHLWGRTVNPHNRALTTRSSSGGEAALFSFHGSPIGFGTDIGGSIRVPAAYCGLYGLRPSHGKMSMRNVPDPLKGQEATRSTPGPLAQCPEDIELVMKAYLRHEPWLTDPAVIRLPWTIDPKTTQAGYKYCFAIAYGDETVTPYPPTLRGLRHVATKLEAAGHAVVKWQGPLRNKDTLDLTEAFWGADGGATIKRDLDASGEPMYPGTVPEIDWSTKDPAKPVTTVLQTWAAQHRRTKHVEWWSDNWQATSSYTGTGTPIDGFITALVPYTAWSHQIDTGKDPVTYEHPYCFEQPLLDLSSGAFPTGLHQDPAIDLPDPDFVPRTNLDAAENAKYSSLEEWKNGPIGLQVTARRLEEEKIVDMLCKIRDALAK